MGSNLVLGYFYEISTKINFLAELLAFLFSVEEYGDEEGTIGGERYF